LTIGDLSSPGDEGGLSLNLTTYLLRIRGSLHLCPCDSDNSSHVEVYSEVVQKKLHCVIATKWETMIAGWLRRKCHCENIVSVTAKFWLHRLILWSEVETYVQPALTVSNSEFCPQSEGPIYKFVFILRVNNDYVLKQHKPIDLRDGDSLCLFDVRTEFLNNI
jgi:hypothetical protein